MTERECADCGEAMPRPSGPGRPPTRCEACRATRQHRAAPPVPQPSRRRGTASALQGVEEQLEGVDVPPALRAIAVVLAERLDSALCSSPAAVAKELRAVLADIADPGASKTAKEVPTGVASFLAAREARGARAPRLQQGSGQRV